MKQSRPGVNSEQEHIDALLINPSIDFDHDKAYLTNLSI